MNIFKKTISIIITVCFLSTTVIPSQALAQGVFNLPIPGSVVPLSSGFVPVMLKGLKVYPDNPFKFDFIIDSGNSGLAGDELKSESEKLARYFLATLTTPEEDLWVNLSPYEEDRIIPDALGQTEMGQELLAQDYILKQVTASLMLPDSETGKEFWAQVYKKAYEEYGTTNIPVDTFNKVWIVPENAVVYEDTDKAFVTESHLKVMLEEDYVALEKGLKDQRTTGLKENQNQDFKTQSDDFLNSRNSTSSNPLILNSSNPISNNKLASNIVRSVLIPLLEKEVNEGKNFAQLRQMFHAMVLATWYKQALKESILNEVYVDKRKVEGLETVNSEKHLVSSKQSKPSNVELIYQQYLTAYKKGVCNILKVEYDLYARKHIPRKYFSGGFGSPGGAAISSSIVKKSLKTLKTIASGFAVGAMVLVGVALTSLETQAQAQVETSQQIQGNAQRIDSAYNAARENVGSSGWASQDALENPSKFDQFSEEQKSELLRIAANTSKRTAIHYFKNISRYVWVYDFAKKAVRNDFFLAAYFIENIAQFDKFNEEEKSEILKVAANTNQLAAIKYFPNILDYGWADYAFAEEAVGSSKETAGYALADPSRFDKFNEEEKSLLLETAANTNKPAAIEYFPNILDYGWADYNFTEKAVGNDEEAASYAFENPSMFNKFKKAKRNKLLTITAKKFPETAYYFRNILSNLKNSPFNENFFKNLINDNLDLFLSNGIRSFTNDNPRFSETNSKFRILLKDTPYKPIIDTVTQHLNLNEEQKTSLAISSIRLCRMLNISFKNLQYFGISVDVILNIIGVALEEIIFGKTDAQGREIHIINIVHWEPRFEVNNLEAFEISAGVLKENIQSFKERIDSKKNAITAIEESTGPLRVLYDGHGNKEYLSIWNHLTYQELAEALIKRGDIESVYLLNFSCLSKNFNKNLKRYLQERGYPSPKFDISQANEDALSSGYGNDFLPSIQKQRIANGRENSSVTLWDVFMGETPIVWEDQDPSAFFAISPEEFKEIIRNKFGGIFSDDQLDKIFAKTDKLPNVSVELMSIFESLTQGKKEREVILWLMLIGMIPGMLKVKTEQEFLNRLQMEIVENAVVKGKVTGIKHKGNVTGLPTQTPEQKHLAWEVIKNSLSAGQELEVIVDNGEGKEPEIISLSATLPASLPADNPMADPVIEAGQKIGAQSIAREDRVGDTSTPIGGPDVNAQTSSPTISRRAFFGRAFKGGLGLAALLHSLPAMALKNFVEEIGKIEAYPASNDFLYSLSKKQGIAYLEGFFGAVQEDRISKDDAVHFLKEIFKKEDLLWMRSAAVKTLIRFEVLTVNEIQELIDNTPDLEVLYAIAMGLGISKNERYINMLIFWSKTEQDNDVKFSIALALGQAGTKEAVERLIEWSETEQDNDVKVYIAQALGQAGTKEAVERLITWSETELNGPVKRSIAQALGQAGTKEDVEHLIEMSKIEKEWYVKSSIALALGQAGTKEAVERLIEWSETEQNNYVKVYIAQALGQAGTKEAVERLITWSETAKGRYDKSSIAQALGQAGTKEAVERLITWSETAKEEWYVKSSIAQALGQAGTKEAVERLIEWSKTEQDNDVKSSIALALGQAGTKEAVERLIEWSKIEQDNYVKRSIAQALGQAGTKEAVERLIEWSKTEQDDRVKSNIAKALFEAIGYRFIENTARDYDHLNPELSQWMLQKQVGIIDEILQEMNWIADDNPSKGEKAFEQYFKRLRDHPHTLYAILSLSQELTSHSFPYCYQYFKKSLIKENGQFDIFAFSEFTDNQFLVDFLFQVTIFGKLTEVAENSQYSGQELADMILTKEKINRYLKKPGLLSEVIYSFLSISNADIRKAFSNNLKELAKENKYIAFMIAVLMRNSSIKDDDGVFDDIVNSADLPTLDSVWQGPKKEWIKEDHSISIGLYWSVAKEGEKKHYDEFPDIFMQGEKVNSFYKNFKGYKDKSRDPQYQEKLKQNKAEKVLVKTFATARSVEIYLYSDPSQIVNSKHAITISRGHSRESVLVHNSKNSGQLRLVSHCRSVNNMDAIIKENPQNAVMTITGTGRALETNPVMYYMLEYLGGKEDWGNWDDVRNNAQWGIAPHIPSSIEKYNFPNRPNSLYSAVVAVINQSSSSLVEPSNAGNVNFIQSASSSQMIQKQVSRQEDVSSGFASSSPDNLDSVGGIDFNANNLDLKRTGSSPIQFNLPPEWQGVDFENISGFVPVIINIVPVTNFMGLLGLSDEENTLKVSRL